MSIDLIRTRLVQYNLKKGQYNEVDKTKAVKKQIILHHTAGGSAKSSIDSWAANPDKVGTPFVIDRDGIIYQAFPSWCWAYGLGLNQANYKTIESQAIQIELACYGQLKQFGDEFYSVYGNKIAPDNVETLPISFRGGKYYEKYTPAQIESLNLLIQYLSEVYEIEAKYRSNIFDINQKALRGDEGLFTHCCYRGDKSDVYPQPNLINMLKSL